MKKMLLGVLMGVFSLAGAAVISLPMTASAGAAPNPASLPPDQIVLVGTCWQLPDLQHAWMESVSHYELNGPPAGVWTGDTWQPAGIFGEELLRFVCVVTVVSSPTPTTAPPVATTLPAPTTTVPVVTTLPSNPHESCPPGEHPDHGFNGDQPDHGFNGDHPAHGFVNCVPDHPIVTTTTVAPTTTTEAPTTTTVPVPVTHCFIVRRVQICTLPHETTTTVEQTTTTEAPTTTTVPVATTLPVTTTTMPPEGPCDGLGDCHVVCDHDTVGTDDCNICIGTGSCDVIECPVGFTLDGNGHCDLVPEQPIAPTTTTVPVATTLPVTTTTEAPTTTTVAITPHTVPPCDHDSYCKGH
jgi:hypothetical protein